MADGVAVGGVEVVMSKLVWRVRVFARRAVPHTPAKRWAYAAALLVIAGVFIIGHPVVGVIVLAALVALRIADLRRTRARRGHLPTSRAYFFEGDGGS